MNEGHNGGNPRKIKAAITTFQSELEDTIINRVEDDLSSVDQRTADLREEMDVKIEERQLMLKTFPDKRTRRLREERAVTKEYV
jgi:hypothetical protein